MQDHDTSELKNSEKRKYPRVGLDLLVQFRSENVQDFFQDYGRNMSIGGMFIETEQLRELGDEIFFQFSVEAVGPMIEGYGKVVRRQEPTEDAPGGVGIEFSNLSAASKKLIEYIVATRLRQKT